MNKHVQIRSLPEATHRKLKMKAAERGLSISDYLRRLIEEDLEKPSWDEIEARMKTLPPVKLPESTVAMIRRERDAR